MPYRNSKLHADRALEKASKEDPVVTGIVHPAKASSIIAVKEAVDAELIKPVLIGPKERIKEAAQEAEVEIGSWKLINTDHSHASAQIAADMAAEGKLEALMKGSLHSDEILRSVITHPKLKTERRMSHVYSMDVRTYHKPFWITDAVINITPDLQTKADIIQNAVDLWCAIHDEDEVAKVAILAAVESVNSKMQATIDAACLCKMADRKQITGRIKVDGPLAFDNAISKEAAIQKGIESDVAGDPDILVAPDLVSANIMCKELTFIAEAEAAGLVVGAKIPVILTSRADSVRTRILSCALAVQHAVARKEGRIK